MINHPTYELDEQDAARALKEARRSLMMSLRDVAGHTGVSASTISRIEAGHIAEAQFAHILALCNCYELSVDEVLCADFLDEDEAFRADVAHLRERVVQLETDLGDLRRKIE